MNSSQSRYQAAGIVAPKIEAQFAELLASAKHEGALDLAPEPWAHLIEAMIDTAFWASLRKEEGHSPKISLAFLPPEQAGQPQLFKYRIPLSPAMLTKLSPGVERPGVHLGVWSENDELYIWGTTVVVPNFCFVLDVSEPALLVIKHRRMYGFGKFTNVAVLKGDQIKVMNEKSAEFADAPPLLHALLGLTSEDSMNVLIQLAVSMRAHKRGGTLLVVPSKSDAWVDSIIHPIKYSVEPAYSGIAALLKQDLSLRKQSVWFNSMRTEIDRLAGLTAVDGATIINDQHELLAFGAKIGRPEGKTRVENVLVHEPIEGDKAMIMNPAHNGGTRHLSAAQFVHDQQDCFSLVASQDGLFTIFSWSPSKQIVQAHRVDTLLM